MMPNRPPPRSRNRNLNLNRPRHAPPSPAGHVSSLSPSQGERVGERGPFFRRRSETQRPSRIGASLSRPVLEISKLSIQRGSTTILADISWRILPGEHWVVLGANGSGKTSLLSALTGYLSPTSGAISVLGRHYGRADWRDLRQQIGLVSSSIRQMMATDEPALET